MLRYCIEIEMNELSRLFCVLQNYPLAGLNFLNRGGLHHIQFDSWFGMMWWNSFKPHLRGHMGCLVENRKAYS